MYVHRVVCALVICQIGVAVCAVSSTERSNKIHADSSASTKEHDLDDNVADSSVTSYSSVVIHHTNKGPDGAEEDQEKQASKSESYFKIQNVHGKTGHGRGRDDKHRRPSLTSSQSGAAYSSTLDSSQDYRDSTTEGFRSKSNNKESSFKNTFPKVKHYESDFRPIEGPTTEEPRRPQRLVTNYNPYHTESDEESDTSGSQEIYRSIPKYRGYEHSGEQSQSSEEYPFKYGKGYKDEKKRGSPLSPLRSHDYKKPTVFAENHQHYSDTPEYDLNDYSTIYKNTPLKPNTPTPPPGMSSELMETLLQQEPQTFSAGEKHKPSYTSKKKFKSAGLDEPTTFNVGYSIGFGRPPSDDVVFGKPKDQPSLKLHVNGEKSVWKQLNSGVEMSHSLDDVKPQQYRVPDSKRHHVPKINVLKNGGSSVYYMNNDSPDIETVPTSGKSTFDHNHALTSSNIFDFSNAMQTPIALPLQGGISPAIQPFTTKSKSGKNLDVFGMYPSLGYGTPIPVLIPNGPKGEAQMVHAIVIPLQSLPNVDLGWGQLPGMFAAPQVQNGITPLQGNHFATTSSFAPSHSPHVHHNTISSGPSSYKTSNKHHSSQHPSSNPFPEIPEKIRPIKYYRKPKDTFNSATQMSSPIVVSPLSHHDKRNLQKELNSILAQEMSRKNHRHTPIGLRPPPKI